MDCSLPGSSVHGILQARIPKRDDLLQRIFLTQGSNPRWLCLLCWQAGSFPLAPTGNPSLHERCLQKEVLSTLHHHRLDYLIVTPPPSLGLISSWTTPLVKTLATSNSYLKNKGRNRRGQTKWIISNMQTASGEIMLLCQGLHSVSSSSILT